MDNLAYWSNLFKKWKEEGTNGGVDVVSNKEGVITLFKEMSEWCKGDRTMRQVLQQKGLVAVVSRASVLPEVVAISEGKIMDIIKSIIESPEHEKGSPDNYESRGSMWAAGILFNLLPSLLHHTAGAQLISDVGISGNKFEKGFVEELANGLAKRLSAPISSSPSLSSSLPASSSLNFLPLSSSLVYFNNAASPFPLRELSRLCMLIIDHPSVLPVINSLLCLQPGLTPEFQFDPLFVAQITKNDALFSKISITAKYALWIHSNEVFSLMVASLISMVTERTFLTDSELETTLHTCGLCHVICRHPSLYPSLLLRLEAAYFGSRSFAVLRIARALHACVILRTCDCESCANSCALSAKPLRELFEPRFGLFVSVLGRNTRSDVTTKEGGLPNVESVKDMEGDARRMNAERACVLTRNGEDAARTWLVMFGFIDWTYDALLALLLSGDKFPAIAEYVAWLVYPEVVSSDFEAGETRDKGIDIGGYKKITQTLLDKSSIKRKEQDGKERDTKKRKRETEQEVLECISELPIPKEMALKVMERYLKEKEVSQHHVQFVLKFALFGRDEKENNIISDKTSPQSQRMALDLLQSLSSFSFLSSSKNSILQWLEKCEKEWRKTPHEKDIMERVERIKQKL